MVDTLKVESNLQHCDLTEEEDEDTEEEKEEDGELADNPEDIIILNVGGVRHETRLQTLKKYTRKTTRLSEIAEEYKNTGKKEFYFDRHPDFFPFILNFYRNGKLHLPLNVCGMVLKEELNYWQIDDKDIEQCCWVHYIKYEETHAMLEMFDRDEKHNRLATKRIKASASLFERTRPKLWRFLQDPYSSKGATAYAVFSLVIVIMSITVLMLETLPYFGSLYSHSKSKEFTSDELRSEINVFKNSSPLSYLLIIDNVCNLYFMFELAIKFTAAPYKRKFLITPLTLIEFVCLIPYYIAITIVFTHPDPVQIFEIVRLLIALRVLRIFRIFVLMKHFMALKILIYTIRASTKELFLLLLVVVIGVVIFSCLVYYMEIFSDEESDFEHIPLACWWALITMTTVGYGDMTPSTGLGYSVGAMCALSGVLVIALSVPAIVQNFTLYYTHAQSRSKLKQRKRKYRQAKWTKITNLIKGNNKSGGLLNLVKLAQKSRRKSAMVTPLSNGTALGGRDKRAHSVGESISKQNMSRLLQRNVNNPEKELSSKEKMGDDNEEETNSSKTTQEQKVDNLNSNTISEDQNTPDKNGAAENKGSQSHFRKKWRSSLREEISSPDETKEKDSQLSTDKAEEENQKSVSFRLPVLIEDEEADVSNSETDQEATVEKKRKKKRKSSDSEYESSSGKDDELLDEAYKEVVESGRRQSLSIDSTGHSLATDKSIKGDRGHSLDKSNRWVMDDS